MADFRVSEQQRPKDLREYAYQISPGWLRRSWGAPLVGVLAGLIQDLIVEGTQQAIAARSLRSPDFATDALDYSGNERMLPRFPAETDSTYKARLLDAWRLWRQSGTGGGIKLLFSLLGFTVSIKNNSDWNWDGDTANWSRFWVVFDDHGWTTDGIWDDPGTWDDGGVWDSNATVDEVRAVRNIVRAFKGAHEICPAICVVFDAVAWAAGQPDGTWTFLWDRNSAASYWDG